MKKSVLITGVNGGIGSVLAKVFKQEGYFVIGTDKEQNASVTDYYFQIDLNTYVNDTIYRDTFNIQLLDFIEGIEILINNAAVQHLGHFSEIKSEVWNETMNINLTAPFLLSQLCFKQLKINKGSIINIASIHANLTKKNFVAYATSKAGLVGLTKAMAVDAQGEIRVNAICPAAIETEMLKAGFVEKEEKYNLLKSFHPTNSIGTAEEVSRLALFIADKKNKFLNGSVIDLDGGISSVLHDTD